MPRWWRRRASVAGWTGRDAPRSWRRGAPSRRRDDEIIGLALATRARLAEAYAAAAARRREARRKAALLDELRAAYRERRGDWGDRWDGFFDAGLDNARLASLGAYNELLPGLRRLLAAQNGDLERFYAAAEKLAALDPELRRRRLDPNVESTTTGGRRRSRPALRVAGPHPDS